MMKKRSSGYPIAETTRRWIRAPSKFPNGTTVHSFPFLNDRSSRYRTAYGPAKSHSPSHTKGPATLDFRTCIKSEICLWSSITASAPGSTSISSSITHIQSNPASYAQRIPSLNPPAPPTLRSRFSVRRTRNSCASISPVPSPLALLTTTISSTLRDCISRLLRQFRNSDFRLNVTTTAQTLPAGDASPQLPVVTLTEFPSPIGASADIFNQQR